MQKLFGPLSLPSGKKVLFHEPLGIDKANVLQMVPINEDNVINGAMLVDEYVAAKCVVEVDGKQTTGEYKTLLDNWSLQDSSYYRRVFDKMFGLNKIDQEEADKAADFLLKSLTSTDGASSPNHSTCPSQNG